MVLSVLAGYTPGKLNAKLCNIHMSEVSVPHILHSAEHIQELVTILRALVGKLDLALSVRFDHWIIFVLTSLWCVT